MKSVTVSNRTVGYHAPRRVAKSPALVVALHPGAATPEIFERISGWSALADRERAFVVAYPEGVRRSWNAGNGAIGYAGASGVDDVGFVSAVLLDAARRYAIDPRRVYLSGFSAGSMMAHWFATWAPGFVAAIAGVAGGLSAIPRSGIAGKPAAVRIVHGYQDTHVPFAGGVGVDAIDPYEHVPIQQAESWWRAQGGYVEAAYGAWGHMWPEGEAAAQWRFFGGRAL